MSKREKIILAALLVALIYAVYTLYSEPTSQNTNVASEKELANVKALSSQLADQLKKDSLTGVERYILERAAAEWSTNPFLEKKLSSVSVSTKGAPGVQSNDFVYSGYLEVNQRRLAVINGMEYVIGEQLESGGYIVKSIEPEKVVLEDISKGGQITLPFTAQIF
jgi:hypothetical protein